MQVPHRVCIDAVFTDAAGQDVSDRLDSIMYALAGVGVQVQVLSAEPMPAGDVIPGSPLAQQLAAA